MKYKKTAPIEIMQWKYPQQKFLQEYLTLFPELTSTYFTKEKFLEQIKPLITIASNNGFEYMANNYGLS